MCSSVHVFICICAVLWRPAGGTVQCMCSRMHVTCDVTSVYVNELLFMFVFVFVSGAGRELHEQLLIQAGFVALAFLLWLVGLLAFYQSPGIWYLI